MPGAQRLCKQGDMTMKTILISAATVLALTSGAFAARQGDGATYISDEAKGVKSMTYEGSASIEIPVAAKDGSDFVRSPRLED